MKGLCHICYISNVIITIKSGKIMCEECADKELNKIVL